jgi:hypothetical protein
MNTDDVPEEALAKVYSYPINLSEIDIKGASWEWIATVICRSRLPGRRSDVEINGLSQPAGL